MKPIKIKTIFSLEDYRLWEMYKRKVDPLDKALKDFFEPEGLLSNSPTVKKECLQKTPSTPLKISESAFRASSKSPRGKKVKIEAQIDLHGMTQAEAHTSLIHFVRQNYDREKRTLLVITGKGLSRLTSLNSEESGVLRREVPRWLMSPALKPMLIEYAEAALKDGGSGALYLFLRKKRIQ